MFFSAYGDEAMHQDTDFDGADPKDCWKVKVKWTQDEVIVYRLHVSLTSCDTNLNRFMFPG